MDSIRIAQTIGITTAGFVAGGTLSLSYYSIPCFLVAPYPLIVRQWQKGFNVAKIAHPALALISSAAYGFVAYQWQGTLRQREAELYGVAIVANLAIWPWTLLVMMPVNKKLFSKHEETKNLPAMEAATEVGKPKGESAHELVHRWGRLNVIRACMPLVGAVIGTWISLAT